MQSRYLTTLSLYLLVSASFILLLLIIFSWKSSQLYLFHYGSIEYVNCSKSNFWSAYNICGRSYPTFPAFVDIDAGRYGKCGIDFNYTKGIAKSRNNEQKDFGEIWGNECEDKVVRSFVKVNQTSEPFRKHCSTCALVFPSGRLLGKGSGSDIDRQDCVIRLNNSPIRGYEFDVGKRTTIRILAHNALTAKIPNLLTVIDVQDSYDILVWDPPNSGKTGEGYIMANFDAFELSRALQALRRHSSVFYGSTNYYDALWSALIGAEPNQVNDTFWMSTGFYSVAIALNVCDKLTIFGMIAEDTCIKGKTHAPYHYYADTRSGGDCDMFHLHNEKKKNKHIFDQEKKVFKEIMKYRALSIIYL